MTKAQTWPGVDPSSPEHGARLLAKKLREKISFSSENLGKATECYVAWIDLMGADNMMSTSVHKAANAVARIHLAIHYAKLEHGKNLHTVAINDGLFVISPIKHDIVGVIRSALIHLVGNSVARSNHPDRFLARSAIAYGPVYFGSSLAEQLSPAQTRKGAREAFSQVVLGAPIIQAYRSESLAPPYGVAIHDSARAFSPVTELPFRTTLWRWWQTDDAGGFSAATPQPVLPSKELFVLELLDYFDYLEATLPYHLIPEGKVEQRRREARRYYLDYKKSGN
jgi:hypothetical protein